MTVKLSKLIPVDKKQCQAEKPNGYNFMTLGGVPGRVRCTNAPSAIITETELGKDGQRGSMSLCQGCWLVAAQQLGPDAFTSRHVDAPRGGKQGFPSKQQVDAPRGGKQGRR